MKTMGQLSVVLLICVLLGQGMWLYHVREIKLGEFRESANDVLLNTTYKYLFDEGLNFGKGHKLTYSLTKDHRFYWYYDNREGYIPIKSPDMVDKLGRMISYDCSHARAYQFCVLSAGAGKRPVCGDHQSWPPGHGGRL